VDNNVKCTETGGVKFIEKEDYLIGERYSVMC